MLIGWALIVGLASAPAPPPEAAQVSVVSRAEFAALSPEAAAPEERAEQETAPAPEEPTPTENASDPAPSEATENGGETAAIQPPTRDPAPSKSEDGAPAPADRVAPQPSDPSPQAETDAQKREAAQPAETAGEREPAPPTAPEAASSEIVTEAEEQAPSATPRPPARPSRAAEAAAPEQPSEPDPAPAPAEEGTLETAAIESAVAEALSGPAEPAETPGKGEAEAGPPLTEGERESFRLAVQDCWVVDVGSEAARVSVTLAFSLNRDGTVRADTLRRAGAEGGSGRAVAVAFQAARRALLRCQNDGYELPAAKYPRWQDIEMTFNPERMRIR